MSPTLLYIDSDAATRRLVTRVLVPAGVRVLEAATIAQGQQIVTEARPDIAIVDVDVAEGEVDEVIPLLRQGTDATSPVILAVTADDRPQHLARVREAGFAAVLAKPLDIDRLAADIARHVPGFRPVTETSVDTSATDGAIPALWRHVLTPLTLSLVQNVATSDGVLLLRSEEEDDWVVVAAHSLRRDAIVPQAGTRIPIATTKWLDEALVAREPVIGHPTPLETSALLPAECRTVLLAPVADDNGRAYGVVVLGERRQRTFGFPPAQVAACVAEATKIATVLRRFEQLDEAISERRREIEELRIRAAWTVAAGDEHEEAGPRARIRLGARLAEQLGLPEGQGVVLEHALRVHDVGRAWLGREVLSLGMLSDTDGQALLDAHAGHTLEILRSLDCPALVVDTVRMSALPWTHAEGKAGLAARIVAVVAAYEALTRRSQTGRERLSPKDAVAEISGESGRRFDPTVVAALTQLVGEMDINEIPAG
jgi:response regulator RpfG family c-di-GMP phosphodiesterase